MRPSILARLGLRPRAVVTPPARLLWVAVTAIALAALWLSGGGAIPGPAAVARALARLWNQQGLFDHLTTSLALELEALAWSTAITLGLAYLSVLPAARAPVAALSKLRFSGLVGWAFVLTLATRDGHALKLWMLVFAMTPFFVTAMAEVVAAIPAHRFDHARALGLGEPRVVWEVVVRGTADQALEALRQQAAMGWMMLTSVEGLVRSEGGLGVLMLDENKHLQLDAVFALIAVVLAVGVVQDACLAWLRRALFPFTRR